MGAPPTVAPTPIPTAPTPTLSTAPTPMPVTSTPTDPESGATLTLEATMAIDSNHATVAGLVTDVAFMDAMQTAGALAFDVDPSMVKVQITEDVARRRLRVDVRSSMHRRLAVVNVKTIYTISIPPSEVAQVEAVEARMTSIASSTGETNPLKQEISTQMSSLPAVSAVTVEAISAPNLSNASSTPALLSSPAPPAAPTSAAPSPSPTLTPGTQSTSAPTLTATTPVVAPTASPVVTHTSRHTFDPTPLPIYEEESLTSSADKLAIESITYRTAMGAVMLHVFALGLEA